MGEAALRIYERRRATVPGTRPFLYYPHARLRYALVRDADYYRWAHVNARGFRGRDVALQKADGALRIIVVGASTVFETTVSGDDRAWPTRLQHWLTELRPGLGVEVINAGVPGYRLLDNLIRLETELYRYRPDVIISYEVHNDLYAALRAGREDDVPDARTPDEISLLTPRGPGSADTRCSTRRVEPRRSSSASGWSAGAGVGVRPRIRRPLPRWTAAPSGTSASSPPSSPSLAHSALTS